MADHQQLEDQNDQATASSQENHVIDYGYPMKPGMDLLLSEINSVGHAISRGQIEEDWQTSSSFHRNLWRNFKEEHYLTKAGLSDVKNCSVERLNELLGTAIDMNSLILLLDVLRSAAKAMKLQTTTAIESTGAKFGRLLQRLPQELLGETIRYACSDVLDLIRLSHVNRRFRQAALGERNLWSRVFSNMPIELVRLFIERSANAPLHVVFNERNKEYNGTDLGYLPRLDDPDPQGKETRLRVKDFVAEVVKSSSSSLVTRLPSKGEVHPRPLGVVWRASF